MAELIPINLLLADRTFRVRVEPKDEEIVRKTIKVINDKIIEFKTQFAGKDMQDYISMVILWYATQQSGGSLPAVNEITARLEKLELLIDKGLEE
ncbi:MAG: cell division protein ZapA [Chitinophagaceae bacterium]